MRYGAILKILGIFIMVFSLSMLPPIFIDGFYQEHIILIFTSAFSFTLVIGFFLWFFTRNSPSDLRVRDGFLIVALFWVVLSFFGSLPFLMVEFPKLPFTDAVFEAVSGVTTTGASILGTIQSLPHGLLFYRQELQFLGGMGIVVLALAILPMLGIGGMQLYKAETPGPMKDAKLTPRLAETAKALWYLYVGLVVLCALAYWVAGMNFFDAVSESFGTVSTGGYSLHDSSFAYFKSNTINIIGIVFMLLGSINFSLHFFAIKKFSLKQYWYDAELRSYVFILLLVFIITSIMMYLTVKTPLHPHNFIEYLFDIVSVMSTTGFTTDQFYLWPSFLPYVMMAIAMIGGCAASTSGGIKVIRFLLLFKFGFRETERLIHPHALLPVKVGKQIIPPHVIEAVWGFLAMYIFIFVLFFLMILATGVDVPTAFGSLAACISNTGASIEGVATSYAWLPTPAKWILILAMLVGRLEIFTVFVLFSPSFWKK